MASKFRVGSRVRLATGVKLGTSDYEDNEDRVGYVESADWDTGMNNYRYKVRLVSENHLHIAERYLEEDPLTAGEETMFSEMATVGYSERHNFRVVVNPDVGRNDAYFKYCNHRKYLASTHVIRLAFKEAAYFTHEGDGKQLWKVDAGEIKQLMDWLKLLPPSKYRDTFATNWDLAIYQWNNECDFTGHPDYDDSYPAGCAPDSSLLDEPQFVPLNTEIPDYATIKF